MKPTNIWRHGWQRVEDIATNLEESYRPLQREESGWVSFNGEWYSVREMTANGWRWGLYRLRSYCAKAGLYAHYYTWGGARKATGRPMAPWL